MLVSMLFLLKCCFVRVQVKCIEGFTGRRTRIVIVVDGLDSCEQDKVLNMLDTVRLLFSDQNAPFVTLLAIDPHVIIKV